MNREHLIKQLEELAERDLTEGSDINDHPCSVAVRAINQCFDDIEVLKATRGKTRIQLSKRACLLACTPYEPSW